MSPNQLGFLAKNYHALRHKHGITQSFAKDFGFDARQAARAHAAISSANKPPPKASFTGSAVFGFVPGDAVLARRVAKGVEGDGWGEARLLEGWHRAEVIKVRHRGTAEALHNVR